MGGSKLQLAAEQPGIVKTMKPFLLGSCMHKVNLNPENYAEGNSWQAFPRLSIRLSCKLQGEQDDFKNMSVKREGMLPPPEP